MSLTLRRAIREDAALLAAMERECFSHPHWVAEDFLRYETIVAELERKLVAFGVKHQTFGGSGRESEFEILNLAVLPAYRRVGVAKLLMQNLMREAGWYYLEVRESNGAAIALYQAFGFTEVGRRAHYYQMPDETAIVMGVKRC